MKKNCAHIHIHINSDTMEQESKETQIWKEVNVKKEDIAIYSNTEVAKTEIALETILKDGHLDILKKETVGGSEYGSSGEEEIILPLEVLIKEEGREAAFETLSSHESPLSTEQIENYVSDYMKLHDKSLLSADHLKEIYNGEGHAKNVVHKSLSDEEKPFHCKDCPKRFKHSYSLICHQRTHTGEKPYECVDCHKRFSLSNSLLCHKKIHTGERPFGCEYCSKSFRKFNDLSVHRRVHTGEKVYECELCHQKFKFRSCFNKHKRSHTGEKPYECDFCHKRFPMLGPLNSHRKIHTGEKMYECKDCSKKFTFYSGLHKHKKIHTGEKPHECEVCHKRFRQLCHLHRHRNVHRKDAKICTKVATVQNEDADIHLKKDTDMYIKTEIVTDVK